jgi:hypothetical protein
VRKSVLPLITVALAALIAVSAFAQPTMPVSQIHKGMRGYGVTVFEGTKLERFDVEILGVLNNIGPGQDLILAKVDSPVVQRAGVIAGMSGSPIYIDGKVIGALAYSWQFAKEPVAGITPIDQMLKIAQAGGGSGSEIPAARMSAGDFLKAVTEHKTDEVFTKMMSGLAGATPASTMSGAKPIAVPLSMSSFAPETVTRFSPWLGSMGFVAVPSGSSASGSQTPAAAAQPAAAQPAAAQPAAAQNANFQPGDAIGAVLLNGDFNVAATGTVTVVDGKQIYAFGHPFLDMGEVSFPMAKSEIVTVMPSLSSSFKFANTGEIVGAFRQDRANGILGTVGTHSDLIPIELTVDGSGPAKTYHVGIVRHSQLSPLILAMAADTVVANAQRAAGERTVLLESEIQLKGFAQPIVLHEGWAGAQARQAIPSYLAVVAGYLMSNEFRQADIEKITLHLHHDDGLKVAKLLQASVDTPDKGHFNPGDTVKVHTLLKPFRGEPFTETFEVKIPDNQPAGPAYLLVGSGSLMNQIDFTLVPPDPRTLEQVLAVLERLRPSTDLTLGLYSPSDGAVTAGVYLPDLPPTMRAVVNGDTSNGAQAPVKYHPAAHVARSLGYIVDGSLKVDLDIKPTI